MKQHITSEQLNELSEKGKEKLNIYIDNVVKRTKPLNDPGLLMSIGQMIEFLDEQKENIVITTGLRKEMFFPRPDKWAIGYGGRDEPIYSSQNKWFSNELCDALWKAVKEELDK